MPTHIPSTLFSRRTAVAGASVLSASAAYASRVSGGVAHQDSSDPLYDTTITTLASGVPSFLPDHTLLLLRMEIETGVKIPPHSHPGPVALYVESGTFATSMVEGSGTITRAGTEATPEAAITLNAGDSITMEAGDQLFYEGAVHTMENAGSDNLELLISALFDSSQPGFAFMNMDMATPAK